jgi:hypothetical protein
MQNTAELDTFFADHPVSRQLLDVLNEAIAAIGPVTLRVTKSQVAFRRRKAFAWAWMPGQYLRGTCAPLVLTVALRRRDPSPRWKEVVEPAKGRFTHHLELYTIADIYPEVGSWLEEAWSLAS